MTQFFSQIFTWIFSFVLILAPLVAAMYIGIWLRNWHRRRYPLEEGGSFFRKHFIAVLVLLITVALIAIVGAVAYYRNAYTISPVARQKSEPMKKIDAHEHFRLGGNINYYLAAMQVAAIEKMVLLPTDWPPSNPKYNENLAELLKIRAQYPDKFIVFATAWNKDPKAAEIIEKALKNGAGGIKFIDWLSSAKYPNDAGPVNSPNMYRVYRVAEKYRVPVLMHIDFQRKPEWKEQFERAAKDFPNVTFILAHYCRAASEKTPDLNLCAQTLDKFPNVYTDISMGGGLNRYTGYFDTDVKPFRDFIIKYQDRILWGADIVLDGKLYKGREKNAAWVFKRMLTDFLILRGKAWLEPLHPENAVRHRGFDLPDEVLRKIYWENPKRVLKI